MGHEHVHAEENIKSLKTVFFLNFFFTIIEIVGGIVTNSLAILSDALHDFGDSFSLGLAWYLEKLSEKKRTSHYTFGYKRFSLLGALLTSLLLLAGSVFIIVHAIPRLLEPEPLRPLWMIGFAVLGICINGLAVFRLRKGKKINQKVVMLHLLEDVLGWAAVLIGSVFILIFNITILDPILSILIALFILWKTSIQFLTTARLFLQSTPSHIDVLRIEKDVDALPQVKKCHDIHIWSLDGTSHVATIHIVVENDLTRDAIVTVKQACRVVMKKHKIGHVTIEIEHEGECCEQQEC